jgi:hypothetical protein
MAVDHVVGAQQEVLIVKGVVLLVSFAGVGARNGAVQRSAEALACKGRILAGCAGADRVAGRARVPGRRVLAVRCRCAGGEGPLRAGSGGEVVGVLALQRGGATRRQDKAGQGKARARWRRTKLSMSSS